MMRLSFGHLHLAIESHARAWRKHPVGAVSDITCEGGRLHYTIKLP